MKNIIKRINIIGVFFWFVTAAMFLSIFGLSSQDGGETVGLSLPIATFIADLLFGSPTHRQMRTEIIENIQFVIRQLARCGLFGLFGLFSCAAVLSTFRKGGVWRKFFLTAAICGALSFFDEWRKQFISGRHFHLREAALNIAAVALGALFAALITMLLRKRKARRL